MKKGEKRFSSEELFELRNTIPIRVLIKDLLAIPALALIGSDPGLLMKTDPCVLGL